MAYYNMVLVAVLVCQAIVMESYGGMISKRQTNNNSEEDIPPYVEFLRGRDGRDGRDGTPGPRGPPGVKGDTGDTGAIGHQGPPGPSGPQGPIGVKGDTGDTGATGRRGPPGPSGGGVTYIRWGNDTCPNTTGTEKVYSGRAGGTLHSAKGGTSDYLCMPDIPQYLAYNPGVQNGSPIYGAEYQTGSQPISGVNDHNVPCAVCRSSQRYSLLMIPARVTCPDTWTEEYTGYLMTELVDHYRRAAVCVDSNPAIVPGQAANTDGALFYHTEAACNGLQCPPYDPQKELTCCVCTK